MKKFSGIFIFFILFFFGLAQNAEAHQPRLAYKLSTVLENPLVIENAEVSQAFYGILSGKPDYYSVAFHIPANLYFQILSPDINGAKTDFSAEIFLVGKNSEELKAKIGGGEWAKYHEDFADDDYLEGPNKTVALGAGLYRIKISNLRNSGKYVLVIGKKELFPPVEALKSVLNMISLKTTFFEKPIWTIFYNKIGAYAGGAILLGIIIVYFMLRFIRRF